MLEERHYGKGSGIGTLAGNVVWIARADSATDGYAIRVDAVDGTTEFILGGTFDTYPAQVVSANLVADPLLVNPGFYYEKWYYRIAAGSPAIDAGLASWAPPFDGNGDARTDGYPDAGADEWR